MATYGNTGYGVFQDTSGGGNTFDALGQLLGLTGSNGQAAPGLYNAATTGGMADASTEFVPSALQKALGYTNTDNGVQSNGWAGTAIGAAQGLFGAYNSMKSYGLAKDQLSESKRQFNANYENQRSLTNTAMQDRQAARVASNPSAYQSVGSYMKENGV